MTIAITWIALCLITVWANKRHFDRVEPLESAVEAKDATA